MLKQLCSRCRNCWCVSGTPFPHHDQSMYGIHTLLGVDYKMHLVNNPFARNNRLGHEILPTSHARAPSPVPPRVLYPRLSTGLAWLVLWLSRLSFLLPL